MEVELKVSTVVAIKLYSHELTPGMIDEVELDDEQVSAIQKSDSVVIKVLQMGT